MCIKLYLISGKNKPFHILAITMKLYEDIIECLHLVVTVVEKSRTVLFDGWLVLVIGV